MGNFIHIHCQFCNCIEYWNVFLVEYYVLICWINMIFRNFHVYSVEITKPAKHEQSDNQSCIINLILKFSDISWIIFCETKISMKFEFILLHFFNHKFFYLFEGLFKFFFYFFQLRKRKKPASVFAVLRSECRTETEILKIIFII